MDKLKTGTGKRLRTEALTPTAVPVPYDAAAMPGATVLGANGQVYVSSILPGETVFTWSRLLSQSRLVSLYVGEGQPATDVTGNTSPKFQIEVASDSPGAFANAGAALIAHANSDATASFSICKSRGTQSGDRTIVQQEDRLASYLAQAADGQKFVSTGSIRCFADGPTGLNQVPGRWEFAVAPLTASTPLANGNTAYALQAMRLNANRNLLIGNTTGTERLSVTGNIQLTNTADSYKIGTNNVVGSRKTGWAAPTGTATRTTFATSTVTTEQLAERLKALIDDLTSHGLIGPTP
jgi:hypothetical protein